MVIVAKLILLDLLDEHESVPKTNHKVIKLLRDNYDCCWLKQTKEHLEATT